MSKEVEKDALVFSRDDLNILDCALAVLCDVKRRAANAPRNSTVVRDAFNSELREVERVRGIVSNFSLPF